MQPDLPEFETRKQKIDVFLKEQGWDVGDRSKVLLELDTKQSDFRAQYYKTVNETLKNDFDSKYADYLLLDSMGVPIAVVEAKRTMKDPILGRKQAEEYADDIKFQMGKDVFIFLSNGYEIWFWDRARYGPRQVKGFLSQKSLERLRFQVDMGLELNNIDVNTRIVDRPKSIEITKRIIEHIQRANRKALVVMATGTGKTRVAMAILDVLMRTNRAQKILFLADRKALRDQAYEEGFKKFFPEESRSKILSGNFDRTSRLYVSTIQTFQEIYNKKDGSGKYMISPAEFDVIISDEAHRSIYNKWRDVFTYLDAIQIGLTATPSDLVDKDTFRFFNCRDGAPTALYDYEEAVREGVLCDFRKNILGAQTHFQISGIRPEDLTSGEFTRLVEEGIDPEDINFDGTELEKKVAVTGTSEAIIREFMDNCLTDSSGNHPAKTIIFAVSKKHAKRLFEAIERLFPEYKGLLARIIVSENSRASELIKQFKEEDWPRVAISVDMLDTGIDVPEVCNLVFAKPVLSKIKFWQMLGRGTRADQTCKNRDWLPNRKKEYFKVFDFWRNFEYWDMHPDGDHQQSQEAITNRIFMVRLKQLDHFRKSGAEKDVEEVKARLLEEIRSLPRDSVSVRESLREVEKALSPRLWESVGLDPVKFLKEKITPLMKFKPDVNLNEASFILRCERLGLAILKGDVEEVERLKSEIAEMIECLPTNLDLVRPKEAFIERALSGGFWQDIRYNDSQMLISELAGLMKYMSKEPRKTIVIDQEDLIQSREKIIFGPDSEEWYVAAYKEKVEEKIKRLAEEHPALRKIKQGEEPEEEELLSLEETLNSPELFITEETLRQTYSQKAGTLVQFIKKVFGLYEFPQPEDRIWDAFQTYIIENNRDYTADQLNFIRAIRTVFAKKKHLDYGDLFDAPFINFGAKAPMPMFSEEELQSFIKICGSLEKELFAEA